MNDQDRQTPKGKRVRYDRGDINSTMEAAIRISREAPVYVFGTAYGFTIDEAPAPFGKRCYKVHAGSVEKIGDWT